MKIIKRSRKSTKTYKYLKVYFEYMSKMYLVEWREDFFTKKKTETWFFVSIIKNYYSEVGKRKEYIFEDYEEVDFGIALKNLFNKTYDKYIFDLRQKKLERILND
jgi:hypothetical protein